MSGVAIGCEREGRPQVKPAGGEPAGLKLAWRGTGGRVLPSHALQSGDEVIGSVALCRLDQLGQLFASIKHAGLHCGAWNAEDVCGVVH